jgi:hypothetical protein
MWLMALEAESDVTVPSVMSARDGSLVQTLNAPDLDRPRHASVYSFLPGIEPPEDNLMEGFDRLGEISRNFIFMPRIGHHPRTSPAIPGLPTPSSTIG